MNTETPIISETQPVKPRRGRPPKYSPEERNQKYRESIDKWRQENKEACKAHRKQFYNEHYDKLSQINADYYSRARNALRLLSEMIEDGDWNDERFKELAFDLVKNKKIIYA